MAHRNRCRLACLAALTAVVLLPMFGGCITPPAIPAAGWDDLDLIDYPPGSERVELTVDDDRTLVGVFVPAGEGAPVVVVLAGAMESVTLGSRHHIRVSAGPAQTLTADGQPISNQIEMPAMSFTSQGGPVRSLSALASVGWPGAPMAYQVGFTSLAPRLAEELWGRELTLTWQLMDRLRDQGLATLFVDYGGVGASSGDRDAACLADDAWAIWEEALSRAGGDPARVALRGTSLGTVAVATLLERGAKPAAVILVAPVRGETVVGHFARWTNASWWQLAALPFLSSLTDADLVTAADEFAGQLHIFVPKQDALLPADERDLLLACCQRPGASSAEHEEGHETLAIAGHDLLPGELDIYREAFGPLRQNPSTVRELLAVQAASDPALTPLLARWPRHRVVGLDQASAQSLLDLNDPDGAFAPQCVSALATLLAGPGGDALAESPAALGERLLAVAEVRPTISTALFSLEADIRGMLDDSAIFTLRFRQHGVRIDEPVQLALYMVHQLMLIETSDEGEQLSPERGRRRALRRLLKGLGVPDKIAPEGSLLAYTNGGWEAVGG